MVPTNPYLLVFYGGVVETNVADAKGRLVIKLSLEIPTAILDLRSSGNEEVANCRVEIWTLSSASVSER